LVAAIYIDVDRNDIDANSYLISTLSPFWFRSARFSVVRWRPWRKTFSRLQFGRGWEYSVTVSAG